MRVCVSVSLVYRYKKAKAEHSTNSNNKQTNDNDKHPPAGNPKMYTNVMPSLIFFVFFLVVLPVTERWER